jgi:hypothetical protein
MMAMTMKIRAANHCSIGGAMPASAAAICLPLSTKMATMICSTRPQATGRQRMAFRLVDIA